MKYIHNELYAYLAVYSLFFFKCQVHLLNEEQVTDKITTALEMALEEALSTFTKKPRKLTAVPLPEVVL